MKNKKKFVLVAVIIGVFSITGTAFAASSLTPAEILANLTGKTVQEVYEERAEGNTLASIAYEEGKLEDFKAEVLEQKKDQLDEGIREGILTQEEADEIYQNLKNNQANCNLEGNAGIGRQFGSCFGRGAGKGIGRGQGNGNGIGPREGFGPGK